MIKQEAKVDNNLWVCYCCCCSLVVVVVMVVVHCCLKIHERDTRAVKVEAGNWIRIGC